MKIGNSDSDCVLGTLLVLWICSVSSSDAVLGGRWTESFHELFFCVGC